MIDNKLWKGVWWFPENHEKIFYGSLEYSIYEGAVLEVTEINEDFSNLFSMKYEFPIILGMDYTGKKITLLKCFLSNKKSGLTKLSINKFYITYIFEGAHFASKEEILFNKMKFSITNLWDWIQKSSLTTSITYNNEQQFEKFNVDYKALDSIKIKLNDYESLSIQTITEFPLNFTDKISISEKKIIEISSDNLIDFNNFINKGYIFNSFITLGLNISTYVNKIVAQSNNLSRKTEDGKIIYDNVNIYYKPNYYPVHEKKIDYDNYLFLYSSIENYFEKVIQIWFKQYNEYASVFSLFFYTLSMPDINIEQQLMNLTEVFESLHRNYYNGMYIERDKYNSLYSILVKAIPNNLDKDFIISIKNRMKYMNEYSLRKRIKSFLQKNGDIFYMKKEQIDSFSNKTADTRNYFAHRDIELLNNSFQGIELYKCVEKIIIVIKVLLLEISGFTKEDIIKFNIIK